MVRNYAKLKQVLKRYVLKRYVKGKKICKLFFKTKLKFFWNIYLLAFKSRVDTMAVS